MKKRKSEEIRAYERQIGHKIWKYRQERNLTQSQLGQLVGVTHQLIQKYETGEISVYPKVLHSLARSLGVPIEHLLPADDGQEVDEVIATVKATRNLIKAYDKIKDPKKRHEFLRLARELGGAK